MFLGKGNRLDNYGWMRWGSGTKESNREEEERGGQRKEREERQLKGPVER